MIVVCGSFNDAQSVSIQNNKKSNSWELHVSWVPHPSEIACLEKIVANHILEMVTINEHSIFRTKNKLRCDFEIILASFASVSFYMKRIIF
jgi:hypothetical protein